MGLGDGLGHLDPARVRVGVGVGVRVRDGFGHLDRVGTELARVHLVRVRVGVRVGAKVGVRVRG